MSLKDRIFDRIVRWPALGAALLIFAAGSARATTIHGPADIEALTETADAVVRGKVTASESHWGAGGAKSGLIFTDVELAPSEQWKGEPVGARISLRAPGGTVDGLSQEVIGSATFNKGDEVVLFLKLRIRGDGTRLPIYEVSHWALGKFLIAGAGAPETSSAALAVRDRSGVECVGCGANESDRIPLEELRARVQSAAAKQGAKNSGKQPAKKIAPVRP